MIVADMYGMHGIGRTGTGSDIMRGIGFPAKLAIDIKTAVGDQPFV